MLHFTEQIVSIGDNTHEMSCKLSPLETIRMKCQILFSLKNKKKKISIFSSAELAKKVVKC